MVQQTHRVNEQRGEPTPGPRLRVVPPAADHEPPEEGTTTAPASPYRLTEHGLVLIKRTPGKQEVVPLTNFPARIVEDRVEDDGVEERRTFVIEAEIHGTNRRVSVPADKFAGLTWVPEQLGASAIVESGHGIKEHTRAAIQHVSGEVPEHRSYAHLGWRQIDGQWHYLHAGGAIGPAGPVPGIDVGLRDRLAHFALPEPPQGESAQAAIRASLRVLELAPANIVFPLYAAVWRAVLPPQVDFGLWLAGSTGVGKSELAALMQQHFGPKLTSRQLPANWSATANALEALAFHAKDALLVVDDFAPAGSSHDVKKLQQTAERLIRGAGNNAGRQRMGADLSLRGSKPPRALVLSTGEDLPKGQSIRARLLTLEMTAQDLRFDDLRPRQDDAAAGLYAAAMAGFVQYAANHRAGLEPLMRDLVTGWHDKAAYGAAHRRTPGIVANLMAGLFVFLQYAEVVGAITEADTKVLMDQCWAALGEAAATQAAHQQASEPAAHYLDLLQSALAAGRAHLAAPDGSAPPNAGSWGWRKVGDPDSVLDSGYWHRQGDCIGWLDGSDVYLDPATAFAAAQRLGRETDNPILIDQRTLHKRLQERGFLRSTEPGRDTLIKRKTVGSKRRSVLHLGVDALGLGSEPWDEAAEEEVELVGWPGMVS